MGALRRFELVEYLLDYKIKVFFETGTGTGNGVRHATAYNFDKIYSIEIIKEQSSLMQEKFKEDSRVEIICGNSGEILKEHIIGIESPILFWLDAHFPGSFKQTMIEERWLAEKDEHIRFPLWNELTAIKRFRSGRDVIIIDDIKIFDEKTKYSNPTPDYCKTTYYKNYIDNFIRLFQKTHSHDLSKKDSGYLTLVPRKK